MARDRRRRLLIAVSPRVLGDALRAILADCDMADIVQCGPGGEAEGRFDLALVSGTCTNDADVVVELLDSGTCVVLHQEDGDQVIELRDASGLVDIVAHHLGVAPVEVLPR